MPKKSVWQNGIIRKRDKKRSKPVDKAEKIAESTTDQSTSQSSEEILQKTLQNLYQKLISVKDENEKARLIENVQKLAGDESVASTGLSSSSDSTSLQSQVLPESVSSSNQPSTSSSLKIVFKNPNKKSSDQLLADSCSINESSKRPREADENQRSPQKKKRLEESADDNKEEEPIVRRVTRYDFLRTKFGLKDFKIYTKRLYKSDIKAIKEKIKADALVERQKKNSGLADEFLSDFTISSKRCELTGKVVFKLNRKTSTSDKNSESQLSQNLESNSEKSEEDAKTVTEDKITEVQSKSQRMEEFKDVTTKIKEDDGEIEVIEMGEDENDDLFVILQDSPVNSPKVASPVPQPESSQSHNKTKTAILNSTESDYTIPSVPNATFPPRRKSFYQVFEEKIAEIQAEATKPRISNGGIAAKVRSTQSVPAKQPDKKTSNSIVFRPMSKRVVKHNTANLPKLFPSSQHSKRPSSRSAIQTHTLPSPPRLHPSTSENTKFVQNVSSATSSHYLKKSTNNPAATAATYNQPEIIDKIKIKVCVYHTDINIDKTVVELHKSNSQNKNADKLNLRPWIPNAKYLKNQEHGAAMLEQICLYADFKCMEPECSFFTQSANIFKKHLILHTGLSNNAYMACAYCQQVFDDIDDLISHTMRVHNFNKYQCPYCFYRSCVDSNVVFHMKKYHPMFRKVILETNLSDRDEEGEYEFLLESRKKCVPPIVCVCKYFYE